MPLYADKSGAILHSMEIGNGRTTIFLLSLVVCLISLSSCSLISQSPAILKNASVSALDEEQPMESDQAGEIPYQRWRISPWDDDLKYVWLVGNYDFRQTDKVEIILYFHGMGSKDYYRDFRKELHALASKRPDKPFIFVGFVDTPYVFNWDRSKGRWSSFALRDGERPELLFRVVNRIFKGVKRAFPNIEKEKTTLTLAGFSGGGRVLDSVGSWLAKAPADDPYAEVFRAKLAKIVYFDCWFDKDVIQTIPTLLASNPGMRIVGTVHMKKPSELADILVERYNMKHNRTKTELTGLGGRILIFRGDSHWDAMISRLSQAL